VREGDGGAEIGGAGAHDEDVKRGFGGLLLSSLMLSVPRKRLALK